MRRAAALPRSRAGLLSLCRDGRAVTAVEYGIMAALLATSLVVALGPLRTGLLVTFDNLTVTLTGDPSYR